MTRELTIGERQGGWRLRRPSNFWAFTPVNRSTRAILFVAVGLIVGLELLFTLTGLSDDPVSMTVAQLALTLALALFVWHPPAAAIALQIGALVSISLGADSSTLLPAAVAAGLVVATCSLGMVALYAFGFVGLLGAAEIFLPDEQSFGTAIVFLVITAVSSLIGYIIRRMGQRTSQLASDLAERERMLETAVRDERERIADELHDFIAHELTIIAMHARVLEQSPDRDVQDESRNVIGTSARQALADIRRVLQVTQASRTADEEAEALAEADTAVERRSLIATVADIERELKGVRTRVETVGVYDVSPRLSRSMDMAMAQFLREAATNIVKHAPGADSVEITFTAASDSVIMRVENTANDTAESLALPDGGYGLARMKERASVLGGSFHAGPTSTGWLAEVQLPVR